MTPEVLLARMVAVDLPVLAHTTDALRRLEADIEEIDLRNLSFVINRDALLTLRVFCYQVGHRRASQITDVSTIERALLLIGTTAFLRTFRQSPTIETALAQHDLALHAIKHLLGRAALGASICRTLANVHRDLDPHEIETVALLHDSAEMLLWIVAPELALKLAAHLRQNPGTRSADAQRAVLGCTLNSLQLKLIDTWQLPSLMKKLMDERQQDDARVRAVNLACALARHLSNGWADPALPDDYSDTARLINADADTAYALVRDAVLSEARHAIWYDQPALAARRIDLN
ncbi:HDOD domain-containing protein [Chitinibacteraceae bacterium HSL-7]